LVGCRSEGHSPEESLAFAFYQLEILRALRVLRMTKKQFGNCFIETLLSGLSNFLTLYNFEQ